MIKRYPGDEFSAVLHNTGAVITFRKTKISPVDYHAEDAETCNESIGVKIVDDLFEITEGTALAFDHVGKWDVNSSTFHDARVRILEKQRDGCKRSHEEQTSEKQSMNTVLVPSRRQRKTMQL